ncbi:M16 family metallopeptidase [Kitasatospora aureofaciens]|nr:pitrilysin family protein [Kitasatospora aureofaciens]ARF82638.1 peptidase M16 [Kitasatospora aureofaciens]OEV35188.1 protease [Kitasatospora aureofaciens]QEV03877.1 insulinase family protein [Streptomyces viridifaciens]UKZ05757.1 insulinase family protein [Streptomyces viridifaciens]
MTFHPQPTPGTPSPWAFPAPERAALGNGITVLHCHRPGQQLVAVEVLLDAPLAAEPEGLDGIAAILARALSEGTDTLSAEEFAGELERAGATLDAHADHPCIRVALEVPASRLQRGLTLLADALRAPALPAEEIERLVANRLDEIVHEQANPARRAAKALYAELFDAADRLSRPRSGTADTVKSIDRAAVKAFYDAHVRPATTTVVVVGDLTGVDLPALLESTLGAWTGSAAEPSVHAPVTGDDRGRVVIVDRPGSVQTQLLIGRIGPDRHDPVWAAQILGTYCLGGTLTSRLDRVLREEKGYTYGVRAFAQPLRSAADGSGRSLLAISGSVDTASTAPALADTWTILRDLAAEGLTDAERDEAVQFLVGVAPLKYETAGSVAGTLADQVEQNLPDDYQAEVYRQLAELPTAAATEAVVAAFPPDRLVTVLVGDAAEIEADVRALGIGEVTVIS